MHFEGRADRAAERLGCEQGISGDARVFVLSPWKDGVVIHLDGKPVGGIGLGKSRSSILDV